MSKVKFQVLLRGNGWRVRRDVGEYGYRLEGEDDVCEFNLPLTQADVATLFKSEGLEWRYE